MCSHHVCVTDTKLIKDMGHFMSGGKEFLLDSGIVCVMGMRRPIYKHMEHTVKDRGTMT